MTRADALQRVVLLGFGEPPQRHRALMLASFAAAHPELEFDESTIQTAQIAAPDSADPEQLRKVVVRALVERAAAKGRPLDPGRLVVHLCPGIAGGFSGAVVGYRAKAEEKGRREVPRAGRKAAAGGVSVAARTAAGLAGQPAGGRAASAPEPVLPEPPPPPPDAPTQERAAAKGVIAAPHAKRQAADAATAHDVETAREESEASAGEIGPSPASPAAATLTGGLRHRLFAHPVASGVVAGAVLFGLVALALTLPRRSADSVQARGGTAEPAEPPRVAEEDANPAAGEPPAVPMPRFAVGQCRVYTSQPGFFVAIDGQPARFENRRPAVTPCAVTVQQGSHTVTVFREGFADASQIVDVEEDTEVRFTVGSDIRQGNSELLAAPWLNLEVRHPVALDSVNSPGPDTDPFLTPDGLTLLFASDRSQGRGIYLATRRSVFHRFDPPQLLHRSPDMPASPSLGAEQQLLVYVVPEKARLWGLVRDNPLAPFGEKRPLRYSERLDVRWESAQLLHDGRLYWVENRGGQRTTFVAPFLPDVVGQADAGVAEELDDAQLQQIRDELVAQIERSIPFIGLADRVTRQRTILTPRTHRRVIVRLVAEIDPAGRKVKNAELLLIDPRTQRVITPAGQENGSLVTRRLHVARDIDRAYAQADTFPLPGIHPRMSPDGLRQYGLDGKRLWRARRLSVREPFGLPETIAELDLQGFVPSPAHRQFWVSHDEQWLIYCDDPRRGGDLYLVRLFYMPHWGVVPLARPIPQKQFVELVQGAPKPGSASPKEPLEEPFDPMETPVIETPKDPRVLPLPYADHWKLFRTLLAERKYDEAEALIRAARGNPQFEPWRELLNWDAEDLQAIRGFWADIERALTGFKPGEPVRVGMARLEFVKYADGVLFGRGKTREVSKPLRELAAADLLPLFERSGAEASEAGQWRRAVFRFYDRGGDSVDFERDGDVAGKFAERLARRYLMLAEAEARRDNMAAAVGYIRRIERLVPQSRHDEVPAITQARRLLQSLYGKVTWRTTGNRNWVREGTTFRAEYAPASRDALLVSEKQYESFELSLEYRIIHDLGQGGVFFHYDGQGQPYNGGYKIHLANDAGRGVDAYSSGALFGIQAPSTNAAKPKGQWNTLRIVVRQATRLTVELNGKRVLEATLADPERPTKGFVALDGTTGGIEYRNVLVTELPEGV